MKYLDTHINEDQLASVSAGDFVKAEMVDETGRPARYVFDTHPRLQEANGHPVPQPWRRLVVHVKDAHELATFRRVWVLLNIQPLEVPF